MKNNSRKGSEEPFVSLKKVLNIVRIMILLIPLLHVSAKSYSQELNLSLNIKNVSIGEFFKQIEANSEYSFFYKDDEVNLTEKISINTNGKSGKSINEILNQVFESKNISYTIKDNYIVLSKTTATNEKKSVDQQKITVKGTVKEAKGYPLIGASVSIINTVAGTSTDLDGSFTLAVSDANAELQFTYSGFVTQTIKVGSQRVINVTLEEDEETLDEIVVVGYGTQKKASVVGAVQVISTSDLKVLSSNLSTSFAGRLAGVVAVQRSGEPGADGADFWIRGVSTFTGMTSPLIVIDGVQASAGDLNALDPEVIASFSILKDATATALYGSRGANGVMIVTTKSGANIDKPIVNARFETSYSSPTKTPKFIDGVTYMNMYNEAVTTRGTGEVLYSDEKIYGTIMGANPYVFPNVNWYDEMFRNGAMSQNFNFNIRGGGKRMDYFSSVSIHNEEGMLRNLKAFSFNNNIGVTRYVLQNNINVYITPTTKASVKINAQLRDYDGSHKNTSDIFGILVEANPVDFPIQFPSDPALGYYRWGGKSGGAYNNGYRNPYAELATGYSENFQSTVLGSITIDQKLDFLTKGLTSSALFSFKNWSTTSTSRSAAYNQFEVSNYSWNADRTDVDDYTMRRVGEERGTSLATTSKSGGDRQIYLQAMLNYDRTFDNVHNLTGMLLYNQEEKNTNNPTTLIESLPRRKQGIAGRLTYAYDYRYLVELNFGYNGSENFAKGNRFDFFPSVGFGYVISRENYFEKLSKTITNLKIRGSWGLVGNDQINDRYLYLSDLDLTHGDMGYTTGRLQNVTKNGPKYLRFANPDITWEVGTKINLGLDFSYRNYFFFTLDFFTETRKDIFTERQRIPDYAGISPSDKWMDLKTKVYGNLGKVRNRGLDFSVDYMKEFSKDFSMSFKGTFTYATNKILEMDQPDYIRYPNLSRVGHPVGRKLLYVADRLYIDAAEVANNPKQVLGGFIGVGDIKYHNLPDINGEYDDVIDASDRVYSGHPDVPEIIYGFGPSFRYKQFDFSFFLQGVARTSLVMEGFHPFGTSGTRGVLQFIAEDYWSEGNNPNIYAQYPRLSKRDNTNNTEASTYWQRDGSFLKLRNAEIGYNHKIFRVYLRGSNLLTFSKFKHWDPEQGGGSGLKYPNQRVINLGVQFSFNK